MLRSNVGSEKRLIRPFTPLAYLDTSITSKGIRGNAYSGCISKVLHFNSFLSFFGP